jgi:hypothetical protein
MTLEPNTSVAVVVSKQWSNLGGVRRFLGPKEAGPEGSDDSEILFARLIDYADPRGLWIELNTARREHDKTVPLLNSLIPWTFVYSVVVITEDREDLPPSDKSDFTRFMEGLSRLE